MSPMQPVLGLQSRGLDGKRAPLETVEDIAALFADVVRATQPRGALPCSPGRRWAGTSPSRIAERLRAAGEEVALVVLLDTYGPNYPRQTSRLELLADNARAFATMTWRARAERIRERFAHPGGVGRFVPPKYEVLKDIGTRDGREASANPAGHRGGHARERAGQHGVRPAAVLDAGAPGARRAQRAVVGDALRRADETAGGRSRTAGSRWSASRAAHSELVDEPPEDAGRAVQRENRPPPAARGQSIREAAVESHR